MRTRTRLYASEHAHRHITYAKCAPPAAYHRSLAAARLGSYRRPHRRNLRAGSHCECHPM